MVVELYYATRFPDRHIRYYNCGISGDTANVISRDKRFRQDIDILGKKPTVATIMLGMNDVGRGAYGPGVSGAEIEHKRQSYLATYQKSILALETILLQGGAKIILIEPSIYDETMKPEQPPNEVIAEGVNGALGQCAAFIAQNAAESKYGLINFYGPMNEINQREQQKNPAFTLVSPDRIHPGPVGHFVMGYIFLKAQGLPQFVANIEINASNMQTGHLTNCKVEKLVRSSGGVEFDCTENSLPFVVPVNATKALTLVPFQQELNQERLAVDGLSEGGYELRIDNKIVGDYPASALKMGVNLAENPQTPQYLQSQTVTDLALKRKDVGGRLRGLAGQRYLISKKGGDPTVPLPPPEKKGNANVTEDESSLQKQYDDLSVEMRNASQPKMHHFSILKK